MTSSQDAIRWPKLVQDCLRREIGPESTIPDPTTDLIETGVLDSMGWVSFLRTIESASGVDELGSLLTDARPSLESIFQALRDARADRAPLETQSLVANQPAARFRAVVTGSCMATGSRTIPSEEVDWAFGMPEGKLRKRAGIESLAYAAEGETELTLGARAAQQALHAAGCGAQELDWIIATSETHRGYPSLAAQLHSQLLARETCGALDVGGACLGLLNGLAVAQGLISSGQARIIAVVTADVHSRLFTPGRVAGEFGGLFGDGASAFLLRAPHGSEAQPSYRLGEFFFGCAGQYAGAIRVADTADGQLDVHFDGEALSRAAVTRLEKVILDLESRSGIARSSLQGLATHQPNPRLVTLLAKQCGLSLDKFPAVAQIYGNLGSSTCGAALDSILRSSQTQPPEERGAIFLASLGPGLLFGGGWLYSPRAKP
ncbi:MAG TPA: 3-oxoacyl-[acyl-carrier-protein] synthase III C-terminal domain-containing protein [Candidatus Acidoferrum sp.]|nr:3-oxoacyl-[acyl-carrier-protein] synthase III C-terminal domain-containing protein [Candidatus Acidoferrum sp.]